MYNTEYIKYIYRTMKSEKILTDCRSIYEKIKNGHRVRDKIIICASLIRKVFGVRGIFSDVIMQTPCGLMVEESDSFSYRGQYDPVMELFDANGGVCIDVGASVGSYSLYAWKKGNRVIAFEPSRHERRMFYQNILLNDADILLFGYAVCNSNGSIPLYAGVGENKLRGNHSILKNDDVLPVYESVLSCTLDSIMPLVDRVDVIKIDVEGAELLVLLGAGEILKKYKPKIIFECKHKKDYDSIHDLLKKYGYAIKQFDSLNYVAWVHPPN